MRGHRRFCKSDPRCSPDVPRRTPPARHVSLVRLGFFFEGAFLLISCSRGWGGLWAARARRDRNPRHQPWSQPYESAFSSFFENAARRFGVGWSADGKRDRVRPGRRRYDRRADWHDGAGVLDGRRHRGLDCDVCRGADHLCRRRVVPVAVASAREPRSRQGGGGRGGSRVTGLLVTGGAWINKAAETATGTAASISSTAGS